MQGTAEYLQLSHGHYLRTRCTHTSYSYGTTFFPPSAREGETVTEKHSMEYEIAMTGPEDSLPTEIC